NAIEHELDSYGGLADRPRVVVMNKIDVPEAEELAELVREDVAVRGWPVFSVSAVARKGLSALTYALVDLVEQARAEQPEPEPTRIVLTPKSVDDSDFEIARAEDGVLSVIGNKPQ